VYNTASPEIKTNGVKSPFAKPNSYETNFFDGLQMGDSVSSAETLVSDHDSEALSSEERKVLDRVADDLARLGRVKRVGLGVKEKEDFVRVWTKTRKVL
jgi:hypothetical protein